MNGEAKQSSQSGNQGGKKNQETAKKVWRVVSSDSNEPTLK